MRLAILSLLIVGAFATTNNDALWHQWKRMYNKEYNGQEDADRRAIWEENVQHIQEHNLKHDLGMVTYTLGLNQFTDMTFEEFKAKYLSQMPPSMESFPNSMPFEAEDDDVPSSVDWRKSGYVTDVKNQGGCGSCWTFSTTGAIEGQYKRKYGNQKLFSEQQLVDCSRSYGNYGCRGGFMENAYRYLKSDGLEEEYDYPYEAKEGRCRYDPSRGVVKVTGFYTVHSGDENKLKSMVGTKGPVAVAVDVERDFMMYRGGVYQSKACSTRHLNHAILAVGYGSEKDQDYWIVKNSWGPRWGEHGYIRMARNKKNMCGIASMASVPVVK